MQREIATGFVPTTVEIDGRTYRHTVWVPLEYTAEQAWPAILSLHGKGECGDDGKSHTVVGLGKAIRTNPERFPAIVIMPQIPVGHRWEEDAMQHVAVTALDAACRAYNIDSDRIALTGLSLGGFGTWSLGARQPERFCALAPICGGGDVRTAPQLAARPIWCFHGDADPVVPVERSREMVKAVRVAGGDVRYSEMPGVTHNSWDPAYGDPELIEWLLTQRR